MIGDGSVSDDYIIIVDYNDNSHKKVEKLSGSDGGSNGIGSGREVKKYIR